MATRHGSWSAPSKAATLRRGAVGLGIWAAATAALVAMMAALQPDIMDAWSNMGFLSGFGGAAGAEASYWTFISALLPVVLAAYAVTQTSSWVNDLHQGRVQMLRAAGVSWTRLVTGRLVALFVASAAITAVTIGALAASAATVGSALAPTGTGRVVVISLLFAAAMGSMAALVAAVFRGPVAVITLAAVVGASYLLTILAPLFRWPDWLNRLSLFWAFGTPYLEWPSPGRVSALLVMAVAGWVTAVVLAEHSPAVP